MKNTFLFILILTVVACTKGDTEQGYRVRVINFVTGEPVDDLELCVKYSLPNQCHRTNDDGLVVFVFDANTVLENAGGAAWLENRSTQFDMPDIPVKMGNSDQITEAEAFPRLFFKTTINQTDEIEKIYVWGRPIRNGLLIFDQIIEYFLSAESETYSFGSINYFSIKNGVLEKAYPLDAVQVNFNIYPKSGTGFFTVSDTENMTLSDTTIYHLKL